MSDALDPGDAFGLAAVSGGVVLLYNATPSRISSVEISPQPQPAPSASLPGFPLFPPSLPTGVSAMSGCSFAIPSNGSFTVTVNFDTGDQVVASVQTSSTASPALFITAFLNGIVAARPTGEATTIVFTRGYGLMAPGDAP